MNQQDRVLSLDQFRGYSVAGMFVVNFLGHLQVTHHVLKHNNTHFSYADSIMPSFILICGYSYRMTFLKRLNEPSADLAGVRKRYLLRSLGLILLSLMVFGFGSQIDSYSDLSLASLTGIFVGLLKANMWEVLAIIGACQILLLPVILASFRTRVIFTLGLALLHLVLTWWFNWDFVYGLPNALDNFLGTSGKRAWDGGFFGLISWSEIMLLGTLLPDLVANVDRQKAVARLCKFGAALMIVGYLASCLTRLYDRVDDKGLTAVQAEVVENSNPSISKATTSTQVSSPVVPDWGKLKGRDWRSLLAEPPLIPPPPKELREPNYWAMDKRIVSQSFVFFSAGLAVLLYALFVRVADIGQVTFSPFTLFGQNPLAAYIIHHMVADSLGAFFPKDSSAVWATFGMLLSMWITYLFVKFLAARGLYLRL